MSRRASGIIRGEDGADPGRGVSTDDRQEAVPWRSGGHERQRDSLVHSGTMRKGGDFGMIIRVAPRPAAHRIAQENWELAPFLVEVHSFVESTSWADEYKRILRLFERTVLQ